MSDQTNNVGATPATEPLNGSQDAPLLIFGDAVGNTINEITLAPGEQKKIKVILSKQPDAITQNFQAQWVMYDSNHQPSDNITCIIDPETKKWLTPLCLSTSDDAVGGMSGNNLISAKVDNGVWRCIGKNPNEQFWYPRDLFTTPVPVAEFTVMAANDWTDNCATFELDHNFTKFTQTADTTVPAASNYTTPCNYSMVLTIKNANAGNVTPPQENNDGQVTPPPQENGGEIAEEPTSIIPTQPAGSTTPLLVFGDGSSNPINEISLAPGEEKKVKMILYKHPEEYTANFVLCFGFYDSDHQRTTEYLSCKFLDEKQKQWITPLNLPIKDESGAIEDGILVIEQFLDDEGIKNAKKQGPIHDYNNWFIEAMCIDKPIWQPSGKFMPPIAVAEFTIQAPNYWSDQFATFEMTYGYFSQEKLRIYLQDEKKPEVHFTKADYSLVLTVKNSNPSAAVSYDKVKEEQEKKEQENHGGTTPPPQENAVSNTQVQLDILMKAWTLSQQKNVEVQFIYNTCRYEKDANGNTIKVSGRKRVNDVKLYSYSESHDIRYLSLEEGEYVDGKVILRVNSRISEAHILQTHITALIDASTGKIGLIINGSSDRNQRVLLDQASSAKLSDVKYLPTSVSQDNSETTPPQNNGEQKEEEEKRKENEINEFINHYPIISIEDGFSTLPKIEQDVKETGAWVRASRASKSGIWYMVNEEMNSRYIYPGNVILVDKDKNFTKNLVEVPFLANERKPLRLDAKYSNELSNSSTLLSSFTRADVNTFVDACLTNFKNGKHDLGSNTSWTYESSERKEGITLGGTIKGVKFSGSIGRNKTVTVAYMKQVMYTVSLNNEYSRPSEIFTNEVDIEKFRRNIEINHTECTPAIIDAVKYGRLITIWVVQEGNEPATLTIDGFNLSVGRTNKSTKYYMLVIGGVAGKDIDKDKENSTFIDTDSQQTIKNALANMKEVSKVAMETATPIEFSVKALANMTTNIEWKVLPYYKTYIPEVKFRVIDDNTGASMKCAVYYLRYVYYGDKPNYRLDEVDGKKLDYTFQCSPKSLCFDIKVDVVATDPNDFNVMLPCIPYDSIQPNEEGEWVFEISFYGSNFWDAKKFRCKPTVPGAVLSTSNKIFMKDYNNSPLRQYSNTGTSERTILQAYMDWTKMMVDAKKSLSFKTPLDKLSDLRPDYE